jgi:hypothetical protein
MAELRRSEIFIAIRTRFGDELRTSGIFLPFFKGGWRAGSDVAPTELPSNFASPPTKIPLPRSWVRGAALAGEARD